MNIGTLFLAWLSLLAFLFSAVAFLLAGLFLLSPERRRTRRSTARTCCWAVELVLY